MISFKQQIIREYNRVYAHLLRWIWRIQSQDAPCAYMFHSVVDKRDDVYSQFAITKESFEKFIRYELSRGQKPMDADILKRAVDNPKAYKNHFVVTFDDIYDSMYENAYPILRKYNVPFVLFVTPTLVDTIDPRHKHPMIAMAHLQEMAADSLCIIAAHGIWHTVFRKLSTKQVERFITDSKNKLEQMFGRPVEFFAFPFGRRMEVSNANIRTLSKCGFFCGFSAMDGSFRQKWFSGRWFLPRILVDDEYVEKQVRNA